MLFEYQQHEENLCFKMLYQCRDQAFYYICSLSKLLSWWIDFSWLTASAFSFFLKPGV